MLISVKWQHFLIPAIYTDLLLTLTSHFGGLDRILIFPVHDKVWPQNLDTIGEKKVKGKK